MKSILLFILVLSTVALAEAAPISWWDGENESKVWVDEGYVARLQFPKTQNPSPLVTLIAVKNPNHRKELLKRNQIVFRNAENAGQKMVATGNVLIRFEPALDESGAESWAKAHGTRVLEKITFEPSTYFMATEAGMAAITKANEWKKLAGVKSAEPIWWREMQLR